MNGYIMVTKANSQIYGKPYEVVGGDFTHLIVRDLTTKKTSNIRTSHVKFIRKEVAKELENLLNADVNKFKEKVKSLLTDK